MGAGARRLIEPHLPSDAKLRPASIRLDPVSSCKPAYRSGSVGTETEKYLPTRLGESRQIARWPPNSTDCNPLDYGVWHIRKSKVASTGPHNLRQLRDCVVQDVNSLDIDVIRRCIGEIPGRLDYHHPSPMCSLTCRVILLGSYISPLVSQFGGRD